MDKKLEQKQIIESISRFLHGQTKLMRRIFVCRYFYCDPLPDIAQRFHMSESRIKSGLFRMRKKLKAHLESEGIGI